MLGLTSSGAQVDENQMVALIRLLSDPEAAATRLKELQAALEKANARLNAADEAEKASSARTAADLAAAVGVIESSRRLEQVIKDGKEDLAKAEVRLKADRKAFELSKAEFEDALRARTESVSEREEVSRQSILARETAMSRAEAAINATEAALSNRAADLSEREKELEKKTSEFQEKVKRVQAIQL
jgi:SMC interacting uncharacterized protein involved in chromosome segregation